MSRFRSLFPEVAKPLIAMAHVPPLPGTPLYDAAAGVQGLIDQVKRDTALLLEGGFDAVLFCNEGDRPYQLHAGLEAATRERVQRQFQAGAADVVVATIAFGMGIDKANVRTVIHAALPGSVEAYYQEIGRAGRDGLASRAILLHSFADRRIHESFFERDYPPVEDLDKVARKLTADFTEPDALVAKLDLDPDTVGRAIEKLAAQGAAQFDMDGRVRGATVIAAGWAESAGGSV